MLIDTHAHLYLKEFDSDREQVIINARQHGIEKILLPNIDSSTIKAMNKMCSDNPGFCYSMIGLHPGSVNKTFDEELRIIGNELKKGTHIAIGEIGIDLYWDKTFLNEQIAVFEKQINWAKEYNLPIVIHARNSFNEIFKVLDRLMDERLFGEFHCFTGGKEEVDKILSYPGFIFGLGGIITFKNAGLDKVVANIPLDKIILETDAPYLAPSPYRGKRNEPAYLIKVAEKLAELKNSTLNQVIEQTRENARELFKLN